MHLHGSPTGERDERGFALIALLVTIFVVTIVGMNMVAFMNSDITHAGIQGDVSRAFYVAHGGLRDAIERLVANQAYTGGTGSIFVQPTNGSFATAVTPWDAAARIHQITSTGQYGRYTRAIRALVQIGAQAPAIVIRNAFLAEGAAGAPGRTYLAPYSRTGAGPDMGSFLKVNFRDTGVRINALTGYTFTLQDGTFADYELFGFASLPRFHPNDPNIPPQLAGRFGKIMQFGFSSADFADLTVRNDPTNKCPDSVFACPISVLRARNSAGGENMTDLYLSSIEKQVASLATVDKTQLLAEARANSANQGINQDLGYSNDGEYSEAQFECVLWYLARHPGAPLYGQIYVGGSVTIGGRVQPNQCVDRSSGTPYPSQNNEATTSTLTIRTVPSGSGPLAGNPAFLAVDGGDLAVQNNGTLQIGVAPANFARQIAEGGVFVFTSPSGQFGRIYFNASSTFRGVGLAYTQNGVQLGPTSFLDLIGASYNDGEGAPACLNSPNCSSFRNWNATAVIRFDPRATSRLIGGRAFLGVLAWWQLP